MLPENVLLGVAVPVIIALIALIGILLRRNNKKPNNDRRLYKNPSDPDKVPLGDVTVGWWERKMDAYTQQIVEAIKELKK